MAHEIPIVAGMVLSDPAASLQIEVGQPDWYAWLEVHTSFSIVYGDHRLTIRKELTRLGSWYWKGYRRINRRLHSHYIGRSCDMDKARLQRCIDQMITQHELLEREIGGTNIAIGQKQLAPQIDGPDAHQYALLHDLSTTIQPIVLIMAPSGAGKTNLLAAWYRQMPHQAIWLTLDPSDNDPHQFATQLAISLNELLPGSHNVLKREDHEQVSGITKIERLLRYAVRRQRSAPHQPLMIMLDNFEVLDQRLADQLIDLVIKRASKRIRLVAASGAAPWERLRRRRAVRMIQL